MVKDAAGFALYWPDKGINSLGFLFPGKAYLVLSGNATIVFPVNIEYELKHEVEEILQNLGLTVSEAIDLYYRQIKHNKRLPFMSKIPNARTKKTMLETDESKNLVECENVDDMFKKLRL